MANQDWTRVDAYISGLFVPADPILESALAASEKGGLPPISVAANEGKLLHILARSIGAKNILEIGTLGGYSTIWLARALPDGGRLVTLELEEKHAAVARSNFDRAGLSDRIEVRVGPAIAALPALASEARPAFDLTFIDADKQSNAEYFEWAVKMSRPGSLIIVDNVIRDGAVADPSNNDPSTLGVRRLNEQIARDARVTVTQIQTVGPKGYDGFAIAIVN